VSESSSPARRIAIKGFQLALTALVTWFIFRAVGVQMADVDALDLGRWRPNALLLIVSSVLLLAGYGISAALWGRLVRDLGGPPIPATTAVRTFLVANLGRYIPGKFWQIAGLAILARKEGVSAPVATGAAIAGQAFAILGATLVGSAALLGGGQEFRTAGSLVVLAMLIGVVVASLPGVSRRLTALWFRLLRSEPPEGVRLRPGFTPRWVVLYTLNWVVYVVAFRVFVLSFGLPGTFMETAPAFAAAYVAGYVMVFSPAGIGIREGVLTFFLAPVTGHGAAAAVSILARVWTTVVEVLPAGALWLVHVRRAGRVRSGEEAP
jgi:hypothetical protein